MSHPLLTEGISDAIGFLGGALAGYWIGKILGLNIFGSGYDAASMFGILLVGLGGGLGLHGAKKWRLLRTKKD